MSAGQLDYLLRVAVACVLIEHGAYGGVLARDSWNGYFGVLGLPQAMVQTAGLLRIGGAEIAIGLIVLIFPVPALLLFLLGSKLFAELLLPAAGELFVGGCRTHI